MGATRQPGPGPYRRVHAETQGDGGEEEEGGGGQEERCQGGGGAAPKPYVTILDQTNDWSLLQCEVHGYPEPEVEWRDSAGNTLPAQKTQDEPIGNLSYITLRTTVTQTNHYRCVATQETISHQVSNEIFVYFSGFSPRWTMFIVLAVLVAGVLALMVLVKMGYITLHRNKIIKVKESSDVTFPCHIGPEEDITSKVFIWKKLPEEAGGRQKNVFLYDGVLKKRQSEEVKGQDEQSEEVKGQDEQFRGRVDYFPEELKQGNASIIIRNTTMADSGYYYCMLYLSDLLKPQRFQVELVVVASPQKKKHDSII